MCVYVGNSKSFIVGREGRFSNKSWMAVVCTSYRLMQVYFGCCHTYFGSNDVDMLSSLTILQYEKSITAVSKAYLLTMLLTIVIQVWCTQVFGLNSHSKSSNVLGSYLRVVAILSHTPTPIRRLSISSWGKLSIWWATLTVDSPSERRNSTIQYDCTSLLRL